MRIHIEMGPDAFGKGSTSALVRESDWSILADFLNVELPSLADVLDCEAGVRSSLAGHEPWGGAGNMFAIDIDRPQAHVNISYSHDSDAVLLAIDAETFLDALRQWKALLLADGDDTEHLTPEV